MTSMQRFVCVSLVVFAWAALFSMAQTPVVPETPNPTFAISPTQEIVTLKPTVGKTPAPSKETPSPTKETSSPTKETPSPTKETPSPTKETPSPTKETPSPTTPAPSKVEVNPTKKPTKKPTPEPTAIVLAPSTSPITVATESPSITLTISLSPTIEEGPTTAPTFPAKVTLVPTSFPTSNVPSFAPTPLQQTDDTEIGRNSSSTETPSLPPECVNGEQDETRGETDIDCGGNYCSQRCSTLEHCLVGNDCGAGDVCGFQVGLMLGTCYPEPANLTLQPPCVIGSSCQHTFANESLSESICVLHSNNNVSGFCISLPKLAAVSTSTEEESTTRWSTEAILANALLGLCLLVTLLMQDSFLVLQILEVGQHCCVGALLWLPSASSSYTAFASTLAWIMFMGLDPSPSNSSESNSTRRLADVGTEDANGISTFADLVGLNKSLLLPGCLIVMCICWVAYTLVQLLYHGLTSLREVSQEAVVRLPYIFSYPLITMSAYTFYSLLVVGDVDSRGMQAGLTTLAAVIVGLSLAWTYFCTQNTLQDECGDSFRSLISDWKHDMRLFWCVRIVNNFSKGMFLGLLTRPTPLQAVLFVTISLTYLSLLVILRPYKYGSTNKIAILGGALCAANTILLVLFAISPMPFSTAMMETLGVVQMYLTIASFALMFMIVLSQYYLRVHMDEREPSSSTVEIDNTKKVDVESPSGFPIDLGLDLVKLEDLEASEMSHGGSFSTRPSLADILRIGRQQSFLSSPTSSSSEESFEDGCETEQSRAQVNYYHEDGLALESCQSSFSNYGSETDVGQVEEIESSCGSATDGFLNDGLLLATPDSSFTGSRNDYSSEEDA